MIPRRIQPLYARSADREVFDHFYWATYLQHRQHSDIVSSILRGNQRLNVAIDFHLFAEAAQCCL